MWLRWWVLVVLATSAAGKGKKHRHQKPGRALLDRLTSTNEGEVILSSDSGGLLPAPLDVGPYVTVAANATCGSDGAEEFCRDTPGKRGVACDMCEGLDGSSSRRHPASHAVDGDPSTWWQSPTLATGEEYSHVEFIATLPAKMELLHVIIKSGPSPRPLAWSLETSSSEAGEDWHMVRAFGDKEHCRKLWNLRPERRRRKARGARKGRADKPTCSSEFASPKPLENGQMHVNLGEGVLARRVRISFRGSHPAPARRRYYTLRTLTLAARCICHGHAKHCAVDAKGAKCSCLHNTCGVHCSRCCAGGEWRPHRPCDGAGAAECSCGDRPCSYDDTDAVVCVNCTENRAGPLCDRCLSGFYSVLPDGVCQPCECDPEGSNGTCNWNKKHHQISCTCHPGFTGHLCDSCEDPSAVFPNCVSPEPPTERACRCDPRGIVDPTRVCDDVCECKKNVVGDRCDTCAPGHFGLSAELAVGCRACYCAHVTAACSADTTPQPERPNITFPLGDAWHVSDAQENQTLESSVDEQGKPYIVSYEVEGWEYFYWYSQSWRGEQLDSYGDLLQATVFWSVVRGDTEGYPTLAPDFILVAADGTKLASTNTSHEAAGSRQLSAALLEGNWFVLGEEYPSVATRVQLLDVLRDLQGLMLRAHFHFDQDEVRLESMQLHRQYTSGREVCACPAAYGGAHCQRCAWGAARSARSPRVTPQFECVPCACNGHAGCDTVDGPCGPCQHNTTGPHCERCLPGHYGNPVQGACKPCACPLYLPSNNFSPNCALASAEGDDFVCTQCPDGYTGDHCEHCDFGYWGSPTTEGSSCQECDCGGAPCDRNTGLCLTCPDNTEGARCDQCKEGYWFGPGGWQGSGTSCVSCGCARGALAAACDARAGQCACRQGWAGRTCDRCDHGHGGVEEGCPACRCGIAARHAACDAESGACACADGAAPPHCDDCLPEYYGLSAEGCLGCNCSRLGAEGNACDIRTGQCRCRPHVVGRACDTCEVGYWGLQLGGCRRCECGAGAAACDPVSGACACAPGVGGAQCDRCLPGYYGFRPAGCLPCPTCSDGKICSLDTGQCVCPPRSRGPECKQCAPGYWSRENGCQPCTCGGGATSNICDPVSGHCKCRTGWTGSRCERCAPGHFGPRCRPCDCSIAGSKDCENGSCNCDEMGRCFCKENVVGDKCDQCLDGTFGLSSENPSGCTACFCFGRAAHCTQAALTRAALHNTNPMHITLLKGDQITTVDVHSPLAVPMHNQDVTISLPWPPAPVYVELDNRFPGDRITSYGGVIRYTVEEEGGEELSLETKLQAPLVSLYSGDIVLDYYENAPDKNGSYAVRFHESLWWVRGREVKASRAALMVVLQKLQRVLIRVTSRAPTADEHVHALLLNVSLDTAIPGLSRTASALGVERCACREGYASESCQKPAKGYWLPQQRIRLSSTDGTVIIAIEGEAKQCDCNGRAEACDPDTGSCLKCTGGTGGPRCSVCAAGYYGSPDSARGCVVCPCPSRQRNFADKCEFDQGQLRCLCKPGYTGMECENCAEGWHRAPDGSCVPCDCDATGALGAACDNSGRCRCRAFATGLKCDKCRAPRTYLDGGECKQCDNCTQTLLDSIEELTTHLQRKANPTELSRIPKPFPAVREFSRNSTELNTRLQNYRLEKDNSRNLENIVHSLEADEHRIFTDTNTFKTEAIKRQDEARFLSLESMSGLEEVIKQRRKIGEQVEALDEFAKGERHLSAHKALKEGRRLFRHINDIKLMDYLGGANDVFDAAHLQLTSVLEYKYRLDDLYKRIQTLQKNLDDWEQKSDDYPKLADVVWTAGDKIAAMSKGIRPRVSAVRDAGLRCRLVLEDITTLSAHNLTDEAYSAILLAQSLAIKFPALNSELATLMVAAEEKEGILYNLTPVYKEKYLKAVERHVTDLNQKAMQYKSLFADTRAASSLGVSAARAWSEVADELREAAAAANAALSTASAAASMAKGARPVTSPGVDTSDSLKQRGAEVLARAEELRKQLDHLIRSADAVSVSLRGLGWAERELGATPRAAVSDTLTAAGRQADRVFVTTRALYDEASELRQKMRYQLRRQLAELQRHGDTALGAAQEHVSQISSNTVRGAELSQALAGAAAARARERAASGARRQPALQALKDAVARARHAAQTISVSVTSVPGAATGCSRAYVTHARSPTVSRLSLALSFDGAVRDGELLQLSGDDRPQDKKNYLRLFVHNKRLRLRWDLGAGEGHIHHPEELLPAHDDTDHTTYRVEIERIWNTVHLRVERAGSPVVEATNSSSSRADSLRPTKLWLGGVPGDGGLTGGLPACVHALHTDDNIVGLWNFAEQPKQAKCTGCTQRWVGPRGGPGALCALGGGYVELKRSSLRAPDSRHFSLALTFRTRDRDALLFMALDAAHNRSISVVLRACRVVFAVQYSGSRLEMTAGGAHCRGRPAHVQAIRVFAGNQLEKGSLRVNGEETLGSPSPPIQSAAALPDLTNAPYWVGGLPPGAGVEAPAPPLLGCIGAVSVDREGYNLMDTPTRHAVEPNCGTRVLRSAVFEGSGFADLPSPAIRRRGAVGLTFSSRSPSGLLLYRAPALPDDDDADDRHYLALVLADGDLEVTASTAKEELKLRTNGTRFDDRRLHVVKLMRVHKQLEMWVDGKRIHSGPLTGPAYAARPRGLYVGGLPEEYSGMMPRVSEGFTGTIADVIVDTQLLGFETAVEWDGAALGRADSEPQHEPHTEPRALQVQPDAAGCTKTPSYAVEGGAAKFGDAPGSHAVLRLQPTNKLSLSLQFRTMRSDGLLVLIPGSKTKPKHYTALMVREGKLRLVVRGRRRKEISLPEFVADGVWRTVSVRVWRGRVSLSRGAQWSRAHAPPAARAHRLLVGGLPADTPPHIPNSIVRVGGFRGCVRRVVVGGRQQELVRDTNSHHALGQCFPNIERGAYFAGDAYATWSNNWSWGGEVGGGEDGGDILEVSLQFRTAKPNGVLIAARSFMLELRDGQVVLTRQSLDNNQAGTEWVTGGRALCDNIWHSVSGRVSRGTLSLSIDGGPTVKRTDVGPLLDEPTQSQRGPLYVGGLPEGAADVGEMARENFKGCLRDVTIGSTKRDWTEMETTHNVLLDSCPVQQ